MKESYGSVVQCHLTVLLKTTVPHSPILFPSTAPITQTSYMFTSLPVYVTPPECKLPDSEDLFYAQHLGQCLAYNRPSINS